MSNVDKKKTDSNAPMHGVLAEFDAVDPLMDACTRIRDAGIRHWDAHTPFPVHGLDGAMGVRPTKLPWLILFAGITGLSCALLMQWWMNAYDYPFRISGKPYFSLPANIPVVFELTVLFSAFAAFFGSLAMNMLPELFNPVFKSERFRRVTDDRFFIYVQRKDPAFDLAKLQTIFVGARAVGVETIQHDVRDPHARIPRGIFGVVAVLAAFTFLPLALIARARESTSELPRLHLNPPAPVPDEMDSQFKFKAQAPNWFFGDGRAMRLPPEGTVASEDVVVETAFHNGKDGNAWTTNMPAQVPLDEQTMARGQQRFGIYCAPCHGLAGHGDGMVSRRAEKLQEGTWVTPTNLHEERVRNLPVGDLFNTITHGIRNMPAYGHSIDPTDRWAIVMYVRALQLSQHAPKSAVPADVLPTLQ
jgi:mono/diheme cytochrome c family protein